MIFTTCSLKWVNELQHDILSQLIIHSTLGFTLGAAIIQECPLLAGERYLQNCLNLNLDLVDMKDDKNVHFFMLII